MVKRRILSLILASLLLVCFGLVASADTTVTTGSQEYLVLDDADLLSDTEELELNETLARISQAYQAQIVVGTIDAVEETTVDEFVEFAYDQLELGYGEEHDGVFLLVCMNPRKYRILSNGFASEAIDLDTIDSIGNTISDNLSEGDYALAFEQFAEECEYYLNGYINGFPFDFAKNLLISLGIGLVIAFIVTGSMKAKLKSVRMQSAATEYTKQGSLQITSSNDFFLYRTVNQVAKESNSSNSSGSSGSSRSVGGGDF